MKTLHFLLLTCALAILGSQGIAQTVNLLVADGSVAETLPGQPANPGNIQVTRTGSTASALTVWVKVKGVALQNIDYRFANTIGTFVIIPAGSAVLNIPIIPLDDWLIEGTELLRVELDDRTSAGNPVPYVLGNNDRADVDILDNEDPLLPPRAVVTVAALDAQGAETPPGTNPASFRLTRTNNLTAALDVQYTLGGTATVGADYTAPPATISIPAGAASADVIIAPINDPLVETPETVTFTLGPHPSTVVPPPPEAYVLGTAISASVTILSEDLPPPPTVTITSPANGSSQTSLAAAPVSIPITFTASDVDGYIVSYTIYDGPRVVLNSTTGYPNPPPAGTPFTRTYTMPNAYGGTHALRVRVTDNSGVTSSSPIVSAEVIYIYPIMTVTAVDAEAAEVAAGETPNPAVFAITVDTPMPADQYVFYRLTSPGPGLDFALPAGYSLTNWPINIFTGPTDYGHAFFPAGTTRVEVVVTPVDDLHLEGTETLTMTLSYPFVITEQTFEGIVQFTEGGFHVDPNAIPVRNFEYDLSPIRTATATILDNDTVPAPFSIVTIATTDSDAQETAPSATANPGIFTITRSGPTALPLTVNYALTPPPRPTVLTSQFAVAQSGVDFAPLSGLATIPAGATSVDIVIAPIYDLLAEPSEIVQVSLRPPTTPLPDPASYMFGDVTVVTLMIRDATLPAGTPIVWIRATDTQAIEENTFSRTASFTVERNAGLTVPLTVAYSIGGTATNGVDYTTLPGTVTIPAGSPRIQIIVDPIADGIVEPNESVSLTLLSPPLEVEPPPYVLGSSTTTHSSAGVSIRDTYLFPGHPFQTRRDRIAYLRHLHRVHAIIPRPVVAAADPVAAPPPAVPTTWAVDASTDLMNWEEIGTVEPSDTSEEFVDVNAGDFESRFYRYRPLPAAAP